MIISTEITYLYSPMTRKTVSSAISIRERAYFTFALSWSNFYHRTRRICKAEFNLKSRFMCYTVLFLRRNCSSFLNYVSRSVLAILRFAFITSLVRFQVKIYCRETQEGERGRETGEREIAQPFVKTFNFIWLLRGATLCGSLYIIYFLMRHTLLHYQA